MEEWFKKHFELLVSYKTKESDYRDILIDSNLMYFRSGAKEFIEFLHKNNIPLIIISAGIGNIIENFLKINNCLYDNIHIISNKIIFNNAILIAGCFYSPSTNLIMGIAAYDFLYFFRMDSIY